MLMRDPAYQVEFFNLGGVKVLSERLQLLTESYLENGEEHFTVDILKEMTNICQKLSADVKQREWLVACNSHRALVLLLSASDVVVLHCSLYALIGLAKSERPRALIGDLNCTEILLRILQDYDMLSKTLRDKLSQANTKRSKSKETLLYFDSLLHCDNHKLLWNVVWIIVQLAEDPDSSNDIRLLGGIPLLLALLQDRKPGTDMLYFGPEGSKASVSTEPADVVESCEETLPLRAAVCSALTELVVNDTNGQQIVQSNGIYLLGLLILPQETSSADEAAAVDLLQKSAFRALRFLFSMERNRQLFKRLFPPDLFEKFIDIGHYVRDLNAYKLLVDKISTLSVRTARFFTKEQKLPRTSLEDERYGCYESKVPVSQGLAAKPRHSLTFSPLQLRHPNVVKYHKAFQEKDKLYVIMELVEGAPLGEHFNSLKEKETRFSEERIWHIFIQIVLGLRYIHKEKHIVHRDLTPNNIMLGENDKVTITDFGLAKQKNPDASKMTSMVGTILYSWYVVPWKELFKLKYYKPRSNITVTNDVTENLMSFFLLLICSFFAQIVEAEYEPVPTGQYSDKVSETISRCLTPNPDGRPDIVEVASIISEVMLVYVDKLRSNEISLEKKLERERKRTQRWEEFTSSSSSSHVFAVPKPPGPRKGPRRQLHVEFAAGSKAGTSNGINASHPSGLSEVSSRRTQSSSSVEMLRRQSCGQMKTRPPTAAATLSISPRKVRQINDPISQILNQLHKIIFITQLPPTLSPNPQRRVVEQFKRALFSPQSSSLVNLKSEVKKVIEGSREVIDLKFGFGDPLVLHHQQDTADKLVSGVNLESADAQEIGITYEMMQTTIENVLMESGYYDMSPCARNRTVPLGPIGTAPASGANLGPFKRGANS
ncbi:PREDICTED: serine/threonine-protein kinase Nek10-like [Acropora digitifera]|uniref:serine/threonine-protein kinase Nek10-like n=1 Tax=Acropora digitifera TaxID=70779 RepID=UPI00077AED9A|nr:PREDICTED: serine/threonine-protein kinase Nek10-like [Acropora digitifera]